MYSPGYPIGSQEPADPPYGESYGKKEEDNPAVKEESILNTQEDHTDIMMYPNPSTGIVFIQAEGRLVERVTVVDLLGKPVRDYAVTDNIVQDKKGRYLLKIKTSDGIVYRRILIE